MILKAQEIRKKISSRTKWTNLFFCAGESEHLRFCLKAESGLKWKRIFCLTFFGRANHRRDADDDTDDDVCDDDDDDSNDNCGDQTHVRKVLGFSEDPKTGTRERFLFSGSQTGNRLIDNFSNQKSILGFCHLMTTVRLPSLVPQMAVFFSNLTSM